MSAKSFFCKSFGAICVLAAAFPALGISSAYHDGDPISLALCLLFVLLLFGLGIGLFIASANSTAQVGASRPPSVLKPVASGPAKNSGVSFLAVGAVALLGVGLTSFMHGDTDADRKGIAILQNIGGAFGIALVVGGLTSAWPAISRAFGRSSPNAEFPQSDNLGDVSDPRI